MAKLLLVEDHEEIWDFLSRRLRRRGFEVLVATDGREGIEMARAERPDLILLDMNLPEVDGWTAARQIKNDPDMGATPIIALTAHALAGDRDKAMAAGCDDYHPKPVDFSRLIGQIDAILQAHQPKEEKTAGLSPLAGCCRSIGSRW
jgi:CheY-like chemotaxis protein